MEVVASPWLTRQQNGVLLWPPRHSLGKTWKVEFRKTFQCYTVKGGSRRALLTSGRNSSGLPSKFLRDDAGHARH